jgi:hypothetical protein
MDEVNKVLENKNMTEEEYCRAMNGLINVINLFEAFGVIDTGSSFITNTAEWFRFKISFATTCVRDFSPKERFDIFNEWLIKIKDTVTAIREGGQNNEATA